jgi:hypothetical protein
MREIHGHESNECNKAIKITANALNESNGNASHVYKMEYAEGHARQQIKFQNGLINDVGVNGITNEVLLTIVADRLTCFQTSKYAHFCNRQALDHILCALQNLAARTAERVARGVEGTHDV